MATYIYTYDGNKYHYQGYVKDINGNSIWEAHYPEFIEDEKSGEVMETSNIFDEGVLNPEDIEGVENYLKSIGVLNKNDELVDESGYMGEGEEYEEQQEGYKKKYAVVFMVMNDDDYEDNEPTTTRIVKIVEADDEDEAVYKAVPMVQKENPEIQVGEGDIYGVREVKDENKMAEGGAVGEKVFQKVKITIKDVDMGGDVVYKGDHWFRKDQIENKSNNELGDYIAKRYGLDYGNTFKYSIVRTNETKTKMARGGRAAEYETYHKTLAAALSEAQNFVENRGYEFSEETYFPDLTMGGVRYGETISSTRDIVEVGGKNRKNTLVIVVYRMDSGTYELTMYFTKSNYAEGGETSEGIDLFEDFENIPPNVQKVLDKHQDAFMDGDYQGLLKAHKELGKIGYEFEYYLDGQAYDLRPIGTKGKSEDYGNGGAVPKEFQVEFTWGDADDESRSVFIKADTKEEAEDKATQKFGKAYEGFKIIKTQRSMKTGGQIEKQGKNKLKGTFELPLELVVYVPSTTTADMKISDEEFENRVDEVETYLSDLFGGYSATEVEGGYVSDEKGLIQEDVMKVTAFGQVEGFEDKFNQLLHQVKMWCEEWGQEGMGFEFEGDLFYINKDSKFKDGGYMAKGGEIIFELDYLGNSKLKHKGKILEDKGSYYVVEVENDSLFFNGKKGTTNVLKSMVISPKMEYGGYMAKGGEVNDDLKKFVKSLPSNTPTIINHFINKFGEDGIVDALDAIIESGETNIKSEQEHKKIMDIIEDNYLDFNKLLNDRFKNKIRFSDGGYMAKGGVTTGDLNSMIREYNEDGRSFELRGAYGYFELWSKGNRLEVGSKKDIYNALIKYRFNEKYADGGVTVTDERLKTMEQSDEERELELYIDNDIALYNQRKFPIEKNLIKKVASGTFDINQAPKIYKYLIDDGIKKYTKDFGGISLSKSEKENLAKDYVNKFLDDADGGQFDEYIPKKYKMAEGGETDDELLEFKIPDWALSSLINGDDSGLEDEDIEKLDKFVKKTSEKYGNAYFMLPSEDERDLGFSYSNDIDNLGSNCSLLYLRPSKGYAEGGETDGYAKGGAINKKYSHFAINKKNNKIVNGWETVSDIESLKYYAKIDLEDMDLKPSDYNILSAKTLMARGINPYDSDNWAKYDEYSDGGETDEYAKGGNVPSIERRVAEVNAMIKEANEKGLEVVDEGGTWQSPMKYNPIKYIKGVLYISYEQLDLYKYNKGLGTKWEKKNDRIGANVVNYTQSQALSEIARMYRKVLKRGYAEGGVTFDEKVSSISKSLVKRKKVSPSVQKDYGKTYDKKEAIESAKRIAGAMRKKGMMSKGGYIIRTDNERISDSILKYADLQNVSASSRLSRGKYVITLDKKIEVRDSMEKQIKDLVESQFKKKD